MAGDPTTAQMNKFRSYVTMLADPNCKDDLKLKATQEISENFEVSLYCFLIYVKIVKEKIILDDTEFVPVPEFPRSFR